MKKCSIVPWLNKLQCSLLFPSNRTITYPIRTIFIHGKSLGCVIKEGLGTSTRIEERRTVREQDWDHNALHFDEIQQNPYHQRFVICGLSAFAAMVSTNIKEWLSKDHVQMNVRIALLRLPIMIHIPDSF